MICGGKTSGGERGSAEDTGLLAAEENPTWGDVGRIEANGFFAKSETLAPGRRSMAQR